MEESQQGDMKIFIAVTVNKCITYGCLWCVIMLMASSLLYRIGRWWQSHLILCDTRSNVRGNKLVFLEKESKFLIFEGAFFS